MQLCHELSAVEVWDGLLGLLLLVVGFVVGFFWLFGVFFWCVIAKWILTC